MSISTGGFGVGAITTWGWGVLKRLGIGRPKSILKTWRHSYKTLIPISFKEVHTLNVHVPISVSSKLQTNTILPFRILREVAHTLKVPLLVTSSVVKSLPLTFVTRETVSYVVKSKVALSGILLRYASIPYMVETEGLFTPLYRVSNKRLLMYLRALEVLDD